MGKSAAIIGNGLFPKKEYPLYLLGQADHIICCDGAFSNYLRHSRSAGVTRLPDAIIGDMDSLSPAAQKEYGSLIVRVDDQDTNDQTKAFRHVIGNFRDVTDIFFLAATGKREDHTIGNMSLLMEYAGYPEVKDRGIRLQMISDFSTILPVTDSISMECGQGRAISIFSPDSSLRICSEGLRWPTDNVVFDNWWKATLNRASEDTVKLTFSHPSIALIVMD